MRLERIRLSIAHKLVLTFVGLVLLVLLITLGLAHWSFERGFLDYMNALEQERLGRLAERIEQRYRTAGGDWSGMDPDAFRSLLQDVAPRDPPPPPPHPGMPPFGGPMRPGFPPPPAAGGIPPRDRIGPAGGTSLGPPTGLYDGDGRWIAGTELPEDRTEIIRMPVRIGGRPIGELRSLPQRHFETPQATAFRRQQRTASLAIGLISLALALGVSVLLARALLAPLRRAIAGLDRLADGDYAARLAEPRRDELGRLMDGLDHLAEVLEQSQTTRRRWLADISHELRTPVTILSGEIEAVKDGVRPLDTAQLDSFDQETLRLRHLIEDLYALSLSDMGGLRYSFAPLDLDEHLRTGIEPLRQRAADRGIRLDLDSMPGIRVKADPARIEQLLRNLAENAIAYTDAPGRVVVRLSREGDLARLRVEDGPPGVADSELERLFEPLYRQDGSRSRRASGAGLGLAICRNIVEAHHGRIWAERSALGGLSVQVSLPLSKEHPP
ncbi:ATP-binding protein [Imhoffiella purpurea]|uniref:Signal transduction histidine-protein kinase/phosphatase MprB n=1 Tax=Imhoffiella purpurea TaxID=1249627 RepID=W9VF41_9GAMM|nr:ATP-binding protein [Imhoffiella purpurea]EXJ15611.1 periplasmic sensor signal transduction histidine kinase [Imhoffiella purpurea]